MLVQYIISGIAWYYGTGLPVYSGYGPSGAEVTHPRYGLAAGNWGFVKSKDTRK